MLNREEKIEQSEPERFLQKRWWSQIRLSKTNQKGFYKKGGGHKYSGRVSITLLSS